MESVRNDLRFALRSWRRRPGFALVSILTISLGIGASAAIFSVVNGVLLQPLPLPEADRLLTPTVISPQQYEISLSIPNFRDWRERNRSFESFAANANRSRTLTGLGTAEVIGVRLVLGDYFETLGVTPALGRPIASDETWEGAEPVAVVTHGFWQRRMGGDPEALGRTITLDAQPFTVIGIMPPDFIFPSRTTEVYLPMGFFSDRMCWDSRGCSQGTWAIGRLRPGITLEMAQADLDRITAELAEEEGEPVATTRLETLESAFLGDLDRQIWILMGAVSFLLLISCTNVAGLMLARGESRRREIALRTALGARRNRLIRQLLTESLMLALVAGAVGIGLARLGVWAMAPWVADNVPSIVASRIVLDPIVLAFTVVASVLSGLLSGIFPALRVARNELTDELKEGARDTGGRGRQRLRSVLVAAEVGLSLVLLISAGLMMRSLQRLQNVDKGFDGRGVITAEVGLPASVYDDKEKTWGFYERFLERVQAIPGVRAAAVSNFVPLGGNSWEREIWAEGMEISDDTVSSVLFHMVSPQHFEVMGIPLVRGRAFDDSDRDGGDRVAIIDETMAEKFWPGEDPLGKRVTFETEPGTDDDEDANAPRIWRTVIGVARNVRHYELQSPSRVQVYVPLRQTGESWTTRMMISAATTGDPTTLAEPIRRELLALNPDLPLSDVETMDGYVARALSGTRIVGGLLAVFSGLALLLAGIGVFGVMSYTVVQRLREFGIYMALGARGVDVLRLVARQGLWITLSGVVAGLAGAYALTRLMAGLLYQVEPVDPLTYGTLAAFLMGVAMLATWLPARRATRVDPAIVLRQE